MRRLALVAFLVSLASAAFALDPGEALRDPALEARARAISSGLRCLVCQNQSIDDSEAGLAKDLRLLVRERLTQGDSDDAVRAYLVARYGDFVLLKPPLKTETILLWGAPFGLLALGALGLFVGARRRRPAGGPVPLSADEEAKLAALMSEPPRR